MDFKYIHDVLHVEVISICFHDETRAAQHPFYHSTIDRGFLKGQKQLNAEKASRHMKAAT